MFSKAHDVSIRDSEINNVGGDLTINNYNVLLQPDSEPARVPWSRILISYGSWPYWSNWDDLSQPFSVSPSTAQSTDIMKHDFHVGSEIKDGE